MDFWISFANFFASAIRLTAPIALGTLACTISERAGVINIGIEGSMLFSGFLAAVGSYYTGSPWVGLLWDTTGISPWVEGFQAVNIPLLSRIPIAGTMLSGYPACIYLGLLAVAVMQYLLHRTAWGLRIRAVGENPAAVATLGINVYRLRMRAVLLGGVFAGMGGAVMCLSSANVFVNDMSAGSGFMAFAANQFGQWSPVGGYLATLLFGVMQALRMRLQSFGIATQLTQMLPYLAALIGIKLTGMRMRAPAANGTPYPHPLSAPCLRRKSAGESQSKGSKA